MVGIEGIYQRHGETCVQETRRSWAKVTFSATKAKVKNRGTPPDSFLTELVTWGRSAASEIFAPNPNPSDIYSDVQLILGPWQSLLHRRAAMLEVMRVHAGFESSWNWNCAKDPGNKNPDPKSWETGAWQVSFDSTEIDHGAMKSFAVDHGVGNYGSFITEMKRNHPLAMEYYARLVRVSIQWAGPLKRHEIDPWLSATSVSEFQELLSSADRSTDFSFL